MTDRPAPPCPYCGAEMELEDYGEFYKCVKCLSTSPWVDDRSTAYAAAMQRYVEALKPLELHEVTGSVEPCVFLEARGYSPIKACDCAISPDCRNVDVMMIGGETPWVAPISEYGKFWRCWSRHPTDAEREAGWE